MASNESVRSGAKFLVMGHNGAGKSTLINKLTGQPVAKVGDTIKPTDHNLIEEIDCTVDGIPLFIYDTNGFGDGKTAGTEIMESAISKMKNADVVLICHKLYDRFDENSMKLLDELVSALGNDLMEHAIFVFTCGDYYTVNCHADNDSPNSVFKSHMEDQKTKIVKEMRKYLESKGIKKKIVNNIPSVITCGIKTKLPTSENWVDDLWAKCEERCKPESVSFVSWLRRNAASLGRAAVGGALTGGYVGSKYGSPGAGAVTGAVVATASTVAAAPIVKVVVNTIGSALSTITNTIGLTGNKAAEKPKTS